jgi:hypothetical protein
MYLVALQASSHINIKWMCNMRDIQQEWMDRIGRAEPKAAVTSPSAARPIVYTPAIEQRKSPDCEPTVITTEALLNERDREYEALLNQYDRENDTKLARVYALMGALANRVEVLERERFVQQDLKERLLDQMHELAEDNDEFRRGLGKYAIQECGSLPKLELGVTHIGCNVFFTPNLTAEERRTKSVWSLHLDVDVRNHRLPQAINLGLYPLATKWGDKKRVSKCFYDIAKGKNHTDLVTDLVKRLIDDGQGETAWGGFVKGYTRNGGRPYVKEQVALLQDHQKDVSPGATQARLHMIIDGQLLKFSRMRPAAGGDGSALWYCQWSPTKT